jgi:hypothetical protein
VLWETAQLSSKVTLPFCIPTSNEVKLWVFHTLKDISCCVLDFDHSSIWVVVYHCHLICISLMTYVDLFLCLFAICKLVHVHVHAHLHSTVLHITSQEDLSISGWWVRAPAGELWYVLGIIFSVLCPARLHTSLTTLNLCVPYSFQCICWVWYWCGNWSRACWKLLFLPVAARGGTLARHDSGFLKCFLVNVSK